MKYGLKIVCLIGILLGLGIPIMTQTKEAAKVSALEKLIQAIEKTDEIKDYRFKGHTNTKITPSGPEEARGINIDVTFEGVNKGPDLAHMNIETLGQEIEIYRQGDKIAVLNPMLDEWMEPPAPMRNLIMLIRPSRLVAMLKGYLKDAKLVDEEQVNQTDCVVIEAAIDRESFQELKGQPTNPFIKEVKPEKIQIKAWCGKDDSLLHKVTVEIAAVAEAALGGFMPDEGEVTPQKMTVKTTMEVTFSDYNNVKLDIPKEAKKVLEAEEVNEEETKGKEASGKEKDKE